MFDPRGGGMTANADRRPGQGAADHDETLVGVVGNQATGEGERAHGLIESSVITPTRSRSRSRSEDRPTVELADIRRLDALVAAGPSDMPGLCETSPPPLDYVLPGLLAGTAGLLHGRGGKAKSLVAMRFAFAVAGGDEVDLSFASDGFAGQWAPAAGPGRVVVIQLEDPDEEIHRRCHRIYQWFAGGGVDRDALLCAAQRITLYPWAGKLPMAPLGTYIEGRFEEHLCAMTDGARLLIVDTLRRTHWREENSNSEMAPVMAVFERVVNKTGAAIVVVHHDVKGNDIASADASRGAAVITDNLRWAARMRDPRPSETEAATRRLLALEPSKTNYGGQDETVWLSLGTPGAEGIPVAVAPPDSAGESPLPKGYRRAS